LKSSGEADEEKEEEPRTSMSLNNTILMESLNKFFDNKEYFTEMCSILQHHNIVSLRLLEFLFTRYSKRNQMLLFVNNNPIYLADIYTEGLRTHGKSKYDCFRRHTRVIFEKHGKKIETTLAQLHFFKHIIPTGVLEFAKQHLEEIKSEMACLLKDVRSKRKVILKRPATSRGHILRDTSRAQSVKLTIDFGL